MIWVEDTQVKIGKMTLPGLFRSMEVTGTAQIEEQEIEGSASKKKQALGYEDARVSIEIILEDGVYETKYYKLQKVQNLFKKAGQGKPIVYDIVSEATAARNVSKVIFKSLSHKEDSSASRITVTIELLEWDAMTVTATAKDPTSGTAKKVPEKTPPRTSSSGCQRGTAPKIRTEKKEYKSPAAKDSSDATRMSKTARAAREKTRRKENRI